MDHDAELLWEFVVGRGVTHTNGPIPEFLAKKKSENAAKTHEQYKDTLTQLFAFLDERGMTTVGDFTEHSVNLFRTHLRDKGLSENTV